MMDQPTVTDAAALTELGERIARQRLSLNRTQAELAKDAGVSPRTLARLESGASTQLTNLVRVLRALGLLRNLSALVPPPAASPLAQLREQRQQRSRASRRGRSRDDSGKPRSQWTWGDDEGSAP